MADATNQGDEEPGFQFWKFSRRAAEARALSRHALATDRASAAPEEIQALNGIIVGSATLWSDLMRARIILQGK
jgi:hypothetical protein